MTKIGAIVTVIVGVAALISATGGYYVFTDGRYFHVKAAEAQQERSLLAQAQTAITMQVVAKESRLRDIEGELRDIEQRAISPQGAWPADAARYTTLLSDRAILVERLEQLK